jgi:hypothetical protein
MRKTRSVEIGDITVELWQSEGEHVITLFHSFTGNVIFLKKWTNRLRCRAVCDYLVSLDEITLQAIMLYELKKRDSA